MRKYWASVRPIPIEHSTKSLASVSQNCQCWHKQESGEQGTSNSRERGQMQCRVPRGLQKRTGKLRYHVRLSYTAILFLSALCDSLVLHQTAVSLTRHFGQSYWHGPPRAGINSCKLQAQLIIGSLVVTNIPKNARCSLGKQRHARCWETLLPTPPPSNRTPPLCIPKSGFLEGEK